MKTSEVLIVVGSVVVVVGLVVAVFMRPLYEPERRWRIDRLSEIDASPRQGKKGGGL